MANVEHSTLTGVDLHEPKGVAAAAANRVYVSNGSGSGSWSQVPASAINAAGILVFQGQKYHIRNETSSGSTSENYSSGVWQDRAFNTEKTDDLGVTLSTNQFTLPAGTYWVEGFVPIHMTQHSLNVNCLGRAVLRLRNLSDGVTLVVGVPVKKVFNTNTGSSLDSDATLTQVIRGQFTLAGTKICSLQQWADHSGTGGVVFIGGAPTSSGENEVYADLVIWKLS